MTLGVLRPAGSLPARVYWVRRFVVLAAVVAVVLIAAWIVPFVAGKAGDLFSGARSATPGPTSAAGVVGVGPGVALRAPENRSPAFPATNGTIHAAIRTTATTAAR
ncbi:MAG TPA: hypothetical protein VFC48_11615, partial [Cellulomonas sp.]|nr:hypothetical protein [Cellulomonas sp.]